MTSTDESPPSTLHWTKLIRYEFGEKLYVKDDDLMNWQAELRLKVRNLTEEELRDAIRWASEETWHFKELTLKVLRMMIFMYRKQKIDDLGLTHGAETCPYCCDGWIDYEKQSGYVTAIPCICPAGIHVESIAYKGQQKGQFEKYARTAVERAKQREAEVRDWVAKRNAEPEARRELTDQTMTAV